MVINKSMKLLKEYGVCPNCGSSKIGKGQGTLLIKDKIFHRSCKCGWLIEIKEGDN